MSENTADRLIRRAREYQEQGYVASQAFGLAAFQERVENWPSGWGDNFEAIVFGDFQPPTERLVFDSLGIAIEPEKLEDTITKTALTVLKARVTVADKTPRSVKDAARRLNLLIGVLSSANQGAPIRWWSYITSRSGSAIGYRLGDGRPDVTIALINLLPIEVRNRVKDRR